MLMQFGNFGVTCKSIWDTTKGPEMFKAGATTYTAPELAGVLEATVDSLDDVKKNVRAKHAGFTAFVKDKTLHQPKRLSRSFTPVSSYTRYKGYQSKPRVSGQDPFDFNNEPEETSQTRFYTTPSKKKKASK